MHVDYAVEAFEEKQSFTYWFLVLAAVTPASCQHLDSSNSTWNTNISLKLLSRPLAAEPFGFHIDNMNGFHIDEAHNTHRIAEL